MAFDALLDSILPTGSVRRAIEALLVVKRASAEVADGPAILEIGGFLDSEIQALSSIKPVRAGPDVDRAELDLCLRDFLATRD